MRTSLSRRSRNVGNDTTKKQTQDLLKQLKGALQAPRVLTRKRATLLTLVTQILQNVSASQRLTKQDLVQIEQCARQTFDIIVTLQEPRSTGQSYLPAYIVQFFNARSFIGQLDSLQQDLTLTLQSVCSINENEVDSKSTSTQDEDPASSSTTHILDKDNLADLQDDLAILPAALQAIQFDLQLLHTEAQNLQRLTAPLQSRAEDFHLCWTSSSEDGELLRTSFKGLAMQLAVQLLIKNATIREVDLTYEPAGLARVEPQGIFGTPAAAVWKKKRVLSKHVSVARMQLQEITQLDRATQTWQNINHRNLVRLYGVRALESQVELIVEPCDFSLKEFLSDRDRELSLIEEETIMKGVARGLAHLHSHNILHQNLCPETIMCAKHLRSNIKLTDFGLCKHESSSMLAYTAPEIMGESPHWTQYADVYAFAMLCYEIKERQEPWVNEYPGTIIEEVQEGVRPSIGDDTAWKSRLLKIVTKAWSARIEERPSMAEIQRELEERIRDRRSTRVLQQMFGLGTTEQPSHEYGQSQADSSSAGGGSRDSASGSSSSNEIDAGSDSEEIKKILKKEGLEKYTKTLFNSGYTTIRKCKNLSHGELRAIGMTLYSDRHKVIQCLRDLDEGKSLSRGRSRSSRSDEESVIKKVLEECNINDSIRKDLIKKGFNSVKKCAEMSHSDLRQVGMSSFTDRERVLNAFKEAEGKMKTSRSHSESKHRSRSRSRGGSSSSSFSSSDSGSGGDDEKRIKKTLQKLEVDDKVRKYLRKKGFTTIKKCKAMQHIDLREAGMVMYTQREKVINTFAEMKASKSRRRSHSRSRDHSREDDKATIMRILKKEGLDVFRKNLQESDLMSLKKLKEVNHADLRNAGIARFADRDKIKSAFENVSVSKPRSRKRSKSESSSSSGSSSGSSGSSSGSSADEWGEIKKVLKKLDKEKYAREFKKAGLTSFKKTKDLTHANLRVAGVSLFSDRDKIITAFRDLKPSKRSKSRSKSKSKKKHSSSSSSSGSDSSKGSSSGSSSSGSGGRSSSSSSSSSGDDEALIKDALKSVSMSIYRKKLFEQGFNTVKKCQALNHADLRSAGITLFSDRDKLMKAMKDLKSSSKSRSKSRSRGRSRGSSSSSESSEGSSDDEEIIKDALKSVRCYSKLSPLLKQGFTVEKALKGSHVELKAVDIPMTQRFEIIKYIKANAEKKPKSHSRRRGSSSSSGSSSDADDSAAIRKALKSAGADRYYAIISRRYPTLKQCKELNHTTLRTMNIPTYAERDQIIKAFQAVSSRSGSRSRSRSSSRRRGGSSSEDEELLDLLTDAGVQRYYKAMCNAGFDTVSKCSKLGHPQLRNMGITIFGDREKILNAVKGAVTPSRYGEDARPNMRPKFAIGSYVRYKGTNARVHMGEIGQVANKLPDSKYLVRFGAGRQIREVVCKEIDLAVSYEKPKKKKKFLGLF